VCARGRVQNVLIALHHSVLTAACCRWAPGHIAECAVGDELVVALRILRFKRNAHAIHPQTPAHHRTQEGCAKRAKKMLNVHRPPDVSKFPAAMQGRAGQRADSAISSERKPGRLCGWPTSFGPTGVATPLQERPAAARERGGTMTRGAAHTATCIYMHRPIVQGHALQII
jgi:hypothetical protein